MKNSLIKKSFGHASIVHGIVILLTLLLPLFRGCSPKKHEVITFIDLSGAPASAPSATPEPETAPEPAIESKPEPKPEKKPEPKPEKKPALEPVKTNAPPKKAETNLPPKKVEPKKPALTNAPAAKPKTEAEKMAAIRQNNPVKRPVVKQAPALDFSGIKSALNSAATGSGPSSGSASGTGSGSGGGSYSPFAWYYDSVKQQMYSVWQQPSGVSVGTTAIATVRVERDGTVSSKSITRRSGNMLFDQSVQNALSDTTRLPVPPADLPSRTIEIEFALSD